MDVSKLLEPFGEDAPSGENLEYDPEFTEMELAAQPGEERRDGEKFIEPEDPDYGDVEKKAEAILGRCHDIRAAVFYAEAVLYSRGMVGFAEATAYVRGCLETYWDTCHPELDEDDDNDPTMRINAVQGMNGAETVIRALRRTALTDSRMFGRLSLRVIEIAEGSAPAPSNMTDIPDRASIGAAFQDTNQETLMALLTAATSAQADLKAIDAIFVEKTPGQGPKLDEVQKVLHQIVRRVSEVVGSQGDAAGDMPEDTGAEPQVGEAAPARGGGGAVGVINSATDVSNALDRIITYYQRNEPSSPVPVLLERAKRLVSADFLTIIKDMAPQGKDQVYTIGGIKDDDY